ncbi:MAG: cupin domain-containing protein [Saprospiraceae bacterium]|nr:cupin domain-containing protein [Saprospiraceae bacterium]
MKYTLSAIEPFEISRGFNARFIHTDSMTLAFVEVEAGAAIPEHAHIHEQVTTLLEGRFDLVISGQMHRMEPGDVCVIPSNVPHYGQAHTACRLMDVFHPVREDFKKGDVAYAIR